MFWTIIFIVPYSVIILLAWINLRKSRTITSKGIVTNSALPDVTIIVAAKDEESNLPTLISDLQSLDYPIDKLEIFIVDDNSSDSTAHLIKKAEKIYYLRSNGIGKKHALASGLEQAKGELILTTDADCRLPSDWVKAFAGKYLETYADLIIGQVEPEQKKGFISIFSALEFYSLQAISGGMALAGRPVICNGASLGFKKLDIEAYLKSVKADIASGDDMFLLHSIKKSSGKIAWLNNPEGTVSTRLPHRLKALFRQRSRWAGKSIYFTDPDTIAVAASTLIANLSIIAAIVISIINPTFWPLLIALFLAKIIPEFLLLTSYLKNPGKLNLLLLFLPASLLYPFYVLITVGLSMPAKKHW